METGKGALVASNGRFSVLADPNPHVIALRGIADLARSKRDANIEIDLLSGVAMGSVRFYGNRLKGEGIRGAMIAAIEFRHAGCIVHWQVRGG